MNPSGSLDKLGLEHPTGLYLLIITQRPTSAMIRQPDINSPTIKKTCCNGASSRQIGHWGESASLAVSAVTCDADAKDLDPCFVSSWRKAARVPRYRPSIPVSVTQPWKIMEATTLPSRCSPPTTLPVPPCWSGQLLRGEAAGHHPPTPCL